MKSPLRPRRVQPITGARLWVIGVAGTALAASLAALWAVPLLRNHAATTAVGPVHPSSAPSQRHGPTTTLASAEQWQPVRQVTSEAMFDQGAVVLDGDAPARLLRSRSIERTEWVDPTTKLRMETTVPHEQVMLIGIDTY